MSFKRNQDGGVAVAERVGTDKAKKTVDKNTSLNNNKESDSNRPTIYKKERVFGKEKVFWREKRIKCFPKNRAMD